jgi:hypothetical protein
MDRLTLPTTIGTVVDYYQETTVLEPDSVYTTLSPNGDPWFGFQVTSSGADKTIQMPYRVEDFAAGEGGGEVDVAGWGVRGSRFGGRAPGVAMTRQSLRVV